MYAVLSPNIFYDGFAEQRYTIKFCVRFEKTATFTHEELNGGDDLHCGSYHHVWSSIKR